MENVKRSRDEIPTIDVNLCTVETRDGIEFGFDTANQVEVEVQTEETDAVKLVVKGRLRAQKPKESTITGHELTLHDNIFNPQLVKVLQGGTVLYWQRNWWEGDPLVQHFADVLKIDISYSGSLLTAVAHIGNNESYNNISFYTMYLYY